MRFYVPVILFYLVVPTIAYGDGFGTFSRQNDLKMTAIVDVGDAEKVDAPFGQLGASDMIKINERCFEPIGSVGSWGGSRRAALVVVDQAKTFKIAILQTSIGSINVDVIPAIKIDCAANAPGELPSDPEKMLEALKKKNDALQMELNRLKNKK